jgi:hypothetical protein
LECWTIGGARMQNRKESSTVNVPTPVAFQTSQIVKTRPPIIRPVELGPAGGPRLPCQRATPHRKNTGGRAITTVAHGPGPARAGGWGDRAATVLPRHDPAQSSRAPVVAALASAGASRHHSSRDATTTGCAPRQAGPTAELRRDAVVPN